MLRSGISSPGEFLVTVVNDILHNIAAASSQSCTYLQYAYVIVALTEVVLAVQIVLSGRYVGNSHCASRVTAALHV